MFLSSRTIELLDVTESQVRIARSASRSFGMGSHPPAGLDFGDCFAYALAVERDEPLLYQGGDFKHTNVRRALSS